MVPWRVSGLGLTPCWGPRILPFMPPRKKREKVQRLPIHLEAGTLAWLREEADRLDVSLSEVVRRALRAAMEGA